MYISHFNNRLSFKSSDAFIGFQKDTPASVIFQATNLLNAACMATKEGVIEGRWREILQWSGWDPRRSFADMEEHQKSWEEAVSWIVSSGHVLSTVLQSALVFTELLLFE